MSIKQQLVRILLRGMKEVYMDRIISDKLYLSLLYRRVLDKKMHWDNPCTYLIVETNTPKWWIR